MLHNLERVTNGLVYSILFFHTSGEPRPSHIHLLQNGMYFLYSDIYHQLSVYES